MDEKKVAIKFLISNNQAGILIGSGGKSINELSELVPTAKIHVSGHSDVYPGTSDRIVLISGELDAVLMAQILIWELFTQLEQVGKDSRGFMWNPRSAYENLDKSQEAYVEGKITIPAAAGGAVLGQGGSNMRNMVEESGARINMGSKDQALFTMERVISIAGQTSQCVKATDMIVNTLYVQDEIAPFANRGTRYSAPNSSVFGGMSMGSTAGRRRDGAEGGGSENGSGRTYSGGARRDGGSERGGRGDRRSDRGDDQSAAPSSAADDVLSTISLSVPDNLVGGIFGKNGSTLREIITLSGANVTVSKREDLADGENRVVTVTGTPSQTQTAHVFIIKRLETPANPAPTRGGEGAYRGRNN